MVGQTRTAEDQLKPTIYLISVRGRLTERLAMALEGMTLSPGGVDSVFTGEVRDQSQLYGLLDRISDLGLELISVQPQTKSDQATADEHRRRHDPQLPETSASP
jgi:hypothetical protein